MKGRPGQPGPQPDVGKRSTRNNIKDCKSDGKVLTDCCSTLKQQIVDRNLVLSCVQAKPKETPVPLSV